jgi:hypothetical protein
MLIEIPRLTRFRAAVLLMPFLLIIGECSGSNLVVEDLAKAWEMYNYTEYHSAQQAFRTALNNSSATKDQNIQARIGLAFVEQYQQPGANPDKALLQYQTIIKELYPDHRFRGLILSRIGICQLTAERPELKAARKSLRLAMLSCEKSSALYQECVLELAASYLRHKPTQKDQVKALAILSKHLPSIKGGHLEGAAHSLAAKLAGSLNDHVRMEAELEAWVESGIHNKTYRAETYFRIARLNELKLNRPNKARQYYELLASKEHSNKLSHFSRTRAAEISAGKFRDGDLALPREAFTQTSDNPKGDK